MTTLYLENETGKERAPDLFRALQEVLNNAPDLTLQALPLQSGGKADGNGIALIPWFSLRPGAFIRELITAWKAGCRRFVLISPAGDKRPWTEEDWTIPAHITSAFKEGIPVWVEPDLAKLKEAVSTASKLGTEEDWTSVRIQQFVEARILYEDYLYKFSHNSRKDLSNQFLAPARLLRLGSATFPQEMISKWKTEIWEDNDSPFTSSKATEIKSSRSATGAELLAAGKKISASLNANLASAPEVADLDNVMSQITRIREAAGLRTRGGGGTESNGMEAAISVGEPFATFRVLVVDDHAAAWRPVFERLHETLKSGTSEMSVRFEFSLDGMSICQDGEPKQVPADFSQFDLVVLDVFLGGERGTTTLRRLRRDFSQLPVLLWTTSRDEEITAEATLANGILLKKTVTWEQLEGAVRTWAPHGKAMRTTTLPNPFFNHAIKNIEYRTVAIEFHEWCLKQLDSFHALDNEFFRYFTDHGGRHVVKLWELMEQALQGFLGNESDNLLLPGDRNARETEIMGLCLAIICHELGMFPMRIGGANGKVEDFSKLERAYLNDVRALHAARGMVLLANEEPVEGGIGRFWNDRRGCELAEVLRVKGDGLAQRLAVLVGYHARLFQSLRETAFLDWRAAGADLGKKLDKLGAPTPVLSRGASAFESAFESLKSSIPAGVARDRLRRQCALFRFVDALDITASRNPADFLIGSNVLPPKQYVENLKRELCSQAGIRNGDVYAAMLARMPTVDEVKKILDYVCNEKLMEEKDQTLAKEACRLISGKDATRLTQTPWKPPPDGPKAWDAGTIDGSSSVVLQKPLDRWLEEVWKTLVQRPGNSEFIAHLKHSKILDARSQEPRLLRNGAVIMGSVAALSVAGELLDEYRAIIDAGLLDKIRLPAEPVPKEKEEVGFIWMGELREDASLPPGLVTLEKVLPPDERKPLGGGGK